MSNQRAFLAAVSIVIAGLGASRVSAKCPHAEYEITIQVTEFDGKPIPNAEVLFFAPGEELGLARGGDRAIRQTDATGTLRTTLFFNTYSGWWIVDRCGADLTDLDVVVVPADREAQRFRLKHLKSTAVERGIRYQLQPISVHPYPT